MLPPLTSDRIRIEGVDFQFRNDKNRDEKNQAIELMESGLIVTYNTIRFIEQPDGGVVLNFEYDILENPNDSPIDQEIEILMGDVCASLVLQALSESIDEPRTDNIEESIGE